MHSNSLDTYNAIQTKIGKRCQLIMDCLRKNNKGMSDRDIMMDLGFSDPNAVRPRVTELIKRGIVEECLHSAECAITGRRVRLVRLVGKGQGRLAL